MKVTISSETIKDIIKKVNPSDWDELIKDLTDSLPMFHASYTADKNSLPDTIEFIPDGKSENVFNFEDAVVIMDEQTVKDVKLRDQHEQR